jgi:hypothetical protein
MKERLDFPPKTKSASGLLRGAPPQKNGPIFSQKFHCRFAKYVSTQILGEFTRDASGQRAK